MTHPYLKAFAKTMAVEKGHGSGLVNDPHDFGGATYCGITRRWFPGWYGWQIIDELKRAGKPLSLRENTLHSLVKDFYREQFWHRIAGDELAAISEPVALELFDTAVNIGISDAVRFLQRALNLLNRQGETYQDIQVDGRIGPKTLSTIKTFLKSDHESMLVNLMNYIQASHYITQAEQFPSQEWNLRGWLLKRVEVLPV